MRGPEVVARISGLLAQLTIARDEYAARAAALAAVRAEFGAPLAALVARDAVVHVDGLGGDDARDELVQVCMSGAQEFELPAIGAVHAIAATANPRQGLAIVLARAQQLSPAEVELFEAFAVAIGVALRVHTLQESERMLRARGELHARENRALLDTLRERHRLQEAMASIRASISSRAPISEVLDAIVAAISDLLDGEPVGLYLIDPADPGYISLVAHRHFSLEPEQHRRRVGTGIAGLAVQENKLVIVDDYPNSAHEAEFADGDGVQSVLATPVHENGRVSGCLIVPSFSKARGFTSAEQDTLVSLAEHVSLALTDAMTVDAMLHQALHDALTGLPNRALFGDRLEHALVRARRLESLTAVMFLDLDRFKHINDSMGHGAGDELLMEVARRLDACRRGTDTAARLGGDEFAVLLEDIEDITEVTTVAARIIAAIAEPFIIGGHEVSVSASIGIASGEPEASDYMRHADVAMYRAKAAGRGQFAIFEATMQEEFLERIQLENDLRGAIGRGEIELHYQPVVDITSGQMVGLEALARWHHPQRGLLSPASFIGVAEETGAIIDLGRHVLVTACEQAAQWVGALPSPDAFMSVNLSGKQLEHPGLVDDVRLVVARSGIDPSQLMLEITETVLMQDTDVMIERLESLRALGVRIAIDDFGTGYSSLRYLRRFPIDALKMAKPFVDGLDEDEESAALARTIIDLASSLGIGCIAEGIETTDQKRKLDELGCRLGQGFHFARPSDSALLTELLRDRSFAFPQ